MIKHHLRFAASVTALACAAAIALAITPPAQAAEKQSAQAARGKYLVSTSGCHDCHTPFKMGANGPEPDMSRALSGHPEDLKMPPLGSELADAEGLALITRWINHDLTQAKETQP